MAQGQVEKSLINLYQDFRAIGYFIEVFATFILVQLELHTAILRREML